MAAESARAAASVSGQDSVYDSRALGLVEEAMTLGLVPYYRSVIDNSCWTGCSVLARYQALAGSCRQ